MRRSILFALAVAACACSKKDDAEKKKGPDLPALTKELVPDAAKGLVVGVSTEADVKKAYPTATFEKDKSLGGEGAVRLDDHPAEHFDVPAVDGPPIADGYLADLGKGLRLVQYELRADGACDFVKKKIAKLDGAEACPGNRKTGDHGDEMLYCLAAGDDVVWLSCTKPRNIEYRISLE